MKKAVFFDIDGTLLHCSEGMMEISPRVKETIRKLQANGDYVFIATGRPYAFLSQAILEFGFDGFILTNGAQVIINDKVIYKDSINEEFVKSIVGEFDRLNIQYILEGEYYSYMKDKYKEFYAFYENLGISRKFIKSDYNLDDIDVYKIEMMCPNDESVDFCLSLIENNPGFDYSHSMAIKSFELYPKKNTKASGILKVLKYLEIPVENSYAFGDERNDIEMLSTVGCGIAMGNSKDEVKKYAKQVTDTVENDGVAVGIEKYIIS